MSEQKIAVIIPCLNEEMTIEGVVHAYQQVLPDADIYVYDNDSTDETAKAAIRAGAKLRFCSTPGKGAVLREAFRDIEADVYVLVDGDGTYPPEKVPEMIDLYLGEPDSVVLGNRMIGNSRQKKKVMSATHALGNWLIKWLFAVLYGFKDMDVLSGSRVFGPQFAKNFPAIYDGFETEAEMAIFAWREHYTIHTVNIPYCARPSGSESKVRTFADGIRIIRLAISGRRKGV